MILPVQKLSSKGGGFSGLGIQIGYSPEGQSFYEVLPRLRSGFLRLSLAQALYIVPGTFSARNITSTFDLGSVRLQSKVFSI